MREIQISADRLVASLLGLPRELNLCLLDSCGVSYLNSHLLIAGIRPVEQIEITEPDPEKTLEIVDQQVSQKDFFSIFTISYDFGLKLNGIKSRHQNLDEPDVFLARFDVLIVHDYHTHKTFLTGDEKRFSEIEDLLRAAPARQYSKISAISEVRSNFTRSDYLKTVAAIQEFIRCGDTYQTNLTQQLRARLPESLTPEMIFRNVRKSHPAPFASFIRRQNDVVISASPERFFRVEREESGVVSHRAQNSPIISVSPIKGTRPRGTNPVEDLKLRNELLNSEKDRAENVMIVDLLRNDLGRICEFGTVKVEKLLDLEEHPTLFHLVSTVSGKLREGVKFADMLRATFPCGSITGAPKIRTMQIIDEIEIASRGLSMGTIGFSIWDLGTGIDTSNPAHHILDLSVAIRTMTVRGREAIFNVGGGIVIDSDPQAEYEETLTKAKALLGAINGSFNP